MYTSQPANSGKFVTWRLGIQHTCMGAVHAKQRFSSIEHDMFIRSKIADFDWAWDMHA